MITKARNTKPPTTLTTTIVVMSFTGTAPVVTEETTNEMLAMLIVHTYLVGPNTFIRNESLMSTTDVLVL